MRLSSCLLTALTVNGQVWTNTLYFECYQPRRPQGEPGMSAPVGPRSACVRGHRRHRVAGRMAPCASYDPMDMNEARAERLADHWVEAQIIFYR